MDYIILGLSLAFIYIYAIYITLKYEKMKDNLLKVINELYDIIIKQDDDKELMRRLP